MFRRLHFCYFWLLWPCSGACTVFFSGCFGHVQSAAFSLFLAVLAMFRRLDFWFFFGRFGHVQHAAFFLVLVILPIFSRLLFFYFCPFCPCSDGCIFVSFGRFADIQAAAFLLVLAMLAIFRRLYF